MRWSAQGLASPNSEPATPPESAPPPDAAHGSTPAEPVALPGLGQLGLPAGGRTVVTPDFAGMTFHEVMAKSALNHVGGRGIMAGAWTVNPYRGCPHDCEYCFARPSHRYLDLNVGTDFARQIVVKVNVAEVLSRELARPSWQLRDKTVVQLGTNTDPYQRAEGRYRLMPDIVDAFVQSGTGFSILTKGTLLRRDLPLLASAAGEVPVSLAMSVAIFDDELQQSLEPGTPRAKERLATVTAVREAGLGCLVFLMPVLPFLTDNREHLNLALKSIKEAGATGVLYTTLRLRGPVKQWFYFWLEREHPEILPHYQKLYGTSDRASREYRRWLGGLVRPLIRRYGLDLREEEPNTGGVPPVAGLDVPANTVSFSEVPDGSTRARFTHPAEPPSAIAPTLF